jgi:DNA mismatch repair protein MutS2
MAIRSFDPEIHLRHQPVEEAIYKLEKYIDDAFVKGISTVRIVHGKGSGALSKAVWALLDSHPLVKSFHFADYGQGDYGVTVTEMENRA